ncbi:MAG: hypothetical protein R3F56_20630 [Planctomycetota bacterium]
MRALLYSQNDFFADSHFRSSAVEAAVYPSAGLPTYSSLRWKANPGHIGGATYWAYGGTTTLVDPLLEEIVAMNSAFVPATGGTATLCVWTPPSTTPRYCFVLLGALQSPGLNLGVSSVVGWLVNRPFSMGILPAVLADPDYGEATYTLRTPPMRPGTIIDMQAGSFELGSDRVALGSSAVLKGG